MTKHSRVPSSLYEITSDRMASSLARPPAFRITCASPSARPAYFAGSRRASIQVRMAKRRLGGSGRLPLSPKLSAYLAFAASTSSKICVIAEPPDSELPSGVGYSEKWAFAEPSLTIDTARQVKRSPKIHNREGGTGKTTVGSGIHSPEAAATGLLPKPSELHSQEKQSTTGSSNRLAAHSREGQARWAVPSRSVNHSPEDWSSWGILLRPGTHRLANRARRDVPSGWGIRSQEERDNSAAQVRSGIHKSGNRNNRHPNDLGIHSRAVGRLGIHSRAAGRLGIHSRAVGRLGIHSRAVGRLGIHSRAVGRLGIHSRAVGRLGIH